MEQSLQAAILQERSTHPTQKDFPSSLVSSGTQLYINCVFESCSAILFDYGRPDVVHSAWQTNKTNSAICCQMIGDSSLQAGYKTCYLRLVISFQPHRAPAPSTWLCLSAKSQHPIFYVEKYLDIFTMAQTSYMHSRNAEHLRVALLRQWRRPVHCRLLYHFLQYPPWPRHPFQ